MVKRVLCAIILVLALSCIFASCDDNKSDTPSTPENPTHTHAYGEWETTKKATCTAEGSKERYCSCGEKQTETIAIKGHSYGAWKTINEPTCTQDGMKKRMCSCGETEIESILALSHDWVDATCVTPKYCKKCEEINSVAIGHNYKEGQCTLCNNKIEPKINLPSTPIELTYIDSRGRIVTKCIIDSITYKIEWNSDGTYDIAFYHSGTKTYDRDGDSSNDSAYFDYKLYDSEGYTVDSNYAWTEHIQVGEKYKNKAIPGMVFNLDPNEEYTLYLMDREI